MIRIISQRDDATGYHGSVGTPTKMRDYKGKQLFVGDVVCVVTYGVDGKKSDDYGIEFVCEENTDIADWTGRNGQYVNGIRSIYNSGNFEALSEFEHESDKWYEKLYELDPDFRVYKVKDHSDLVLGEKIGYLHVVEVDSLEWRRISKWKNMK